MSWINKEGKTEVRTATIVFSKDSENIIELYSLQKYLSQLHFSSFRSQKDVEHIIKCDLSRLIDHPVKVTCYEPEKYWPTLNWNGFLLDKLNVQCNEFLRNPNLIQVSQNDTCDETLYTHLLRSICPENKTTDLASLLIDYNGLRLCKESILKYIISYREEVTYMESLSDNMITDILNSTKSERIIIDLRFSRRWGMDINSIRSNQPLVTTFENVFGRQERQ